MIMLSVKLLVALFLPVLSAWALLRYCFANRRLPAALSLALSYALGMGFVGIWMLFLSIAKLPLVWATTGAPLTVIFLIFLALNLKLRLETGRLNFFHTTEFSQTEYLPAASSKILTRVFISALLFFILITICTIFWRSFLMPVYTWDAIATAAFKAKIFFIQQALFELNKLPHANYPLFVPFLETWVAMNLGQWHEQLVKIVFPFACLSFITLCFYFLKYYTSKTWAILGISLILSSNLFMIHSTIAYRDFFIMYYFCLAIIMMLLWGRIRHDGLLWISSFFAGVTSFVKTEGSAYLFIILAAFFYLLFLLKDMSLRKKLVKAVIYGIPSVSILLAFHLYKIFYASLKLIGNEEKEKIEFAFANFSRIPETVGAYFHCMFMQNNWGIVWFIFALSLAHFIWQKKSRETQVLLVSMGLFFLLYIAVSVATPSYKWLVGPQRATGLARIFLHYFPLAPLFIILTNYEANFLGNPLKPSTPPPTKAARPKKRKRRKK